MSLRKTIWGTPTRRIIYRFLEIFVLAGLSAVLNSVELENALILAFGSGIAAALLKLARDLTNKD